MELFTAPIETPPSQGDIERFEKALMQVEEAEDAFEPEVKKLNKVLSDGILAKKYKGKNTLAMIRRSYESKTIRIAFVTLMLFAKFMPHASAGEKGEKGSTGGKIQTEAMTKTSSDNSNIKYLAVKSGGPKPHNNTGKGPSFNPESSISDSDDTEYDLVDFRENQDKVVLSMSNFFETDKNEVIPENQKKILEGFNKYLGSINSQNFKQVMMSSFVFEGSSDPRKTSNWGGKNENLTKARIDVASKLFKKAVSEFDFKGKISAEQVKKLKSKLVKIFFPTTEGKEKGVTDLTDLTNSETGQKYSQAEADDMQKNNPEKYKELLEKCRYTNFKIELNMFGEMTQYDTLHILADESGSMKYTNEIMSNHLAKANYDKQVNLLHYSDALNSKFKVVCQNSAEAAGKIKTEYKDDFSGNERQVNATLAYITQLAEQATKDKENGKTPGKQVVFVATDEALQDIDPAILELLSIKAKQANADVKFLVAYGDEKKGIKNSNEKKGILEISLKSLSERINKLVKVINTEKEKNNSEKKENQAEQKVNDFYQENYTKSLASMDLIFTKTDKNSKDLRYGLFKIFGNKISDKDILIKVIAKNYNGDSGWRNIQKLLRQYIALDKNEAFDILENFIQAAQFNNVIQKACQNLSPDQIPDSNPNIKLINLGKFKTEGGVIAVPAVGITGEKAVS